ncbi:MAG: hypothetical protein ISS28_00080 [Candidatus Cloacimonetes bacterium]|nr:hypothetical protein [Candidatus Cloacimonadota bacterium]MBL7085484.1 hypothetical protein [Candidatus Cloacimonadota bacterium]
MTLVISVRVPDGIAIGADSLSTTHSNLRFKGNIETKCPKCGKRILLKDLPGPPIRIPVANFPTAQKLFPIRENFGVGFYGMSIINGITIYNHIKSNNKKWENFTEVSQLADALGKYFHNELKKQIKDIEKAPDSFIPLGFQLVGFDEESKPWGQTVTVYLGKNIKTEVKDKIGCSFGGEGYVVKKLWELRKEMGKGALYASFSLQDAVEYIDFLIGTTAKFQKFANMIPTVSEPVDIAVITGYSGFKWIKSKGYIKILEKN